ncbi:MAG: TPM domain-containing protein [Bacteroidales bacterium]|nr:TPM domain-containing protein [Bacteroidales bacterium]
MKPSEFLSEKEKKKIIHAIEEAEKNTSGEIRLHIEKDCRTDVLDRAAYIFEKLKMHKTKLRNGVLFYLALENRKFAILGDAGINKVVPDNFWEDVKETVLKYFREGNYADGLVKGILMTGEKLKEHFPYQQDDINELSNDISFGDKMGK